MSQMQSSAQKELPLLDINKINTENGIQVVNRTQRFVLNIPELPDGGDLLITPAGEIMKYKGEPKLADDEFICYHWGQVVVGIKSTGDVRRALEDDEIQIERGVVFRNEADQCWQAVRGDGNECILFTDANAEQAFKMRSFVELSGLAQKPSLEVVNAILEYATSLGLTDRQNKKAVDVAKEMKVIDSSNPYHMVVIKPDIHKAVYIPEAFTADTKRKQVYPDGAVILDNGKHKWPIKTEVFMRNFKEVSQGYERDLGSINQEFGI